MNTGLWRVGDIVPGEVGIDRFWIRDFDSNYRGDYRIVRHATLIQLCARLDQVMVDDRLAPGCGAVVGGPADGTEDWYQDDGGKWREGGEGMSRELSDDHPDVVMVRKHLAELTEHFDAVQIFATRCESGEMGGTINIQVGSGNWFTRYGHVRTWLTKEDEGTRIDVREEKGEQ